VKSRESASESALRHPRIDVLGVGLSAVNMDCALDLAEGCIATGQSSYVCMTGVHGVMEAQSNPHHCRVHFMANLRRRSVDKGYRHYLYGGRPGVAPDLKNALEERFPGLRIVGTFTPPFRNLTQEEEAELLTDVREAKPDIFWVGLSTPKQEWFMARYVNRLQVPLLVGVGAAFDVHTGRIDDAPAWIKRAGLQWLHRLLQDPKRLWKRYLLNNPAFLWRITLQLLRRSRHQHQAVRVPEATSSTTNS
jgi:N-acetylglucosaminyldiphosphoundecaprenol N-acetyl-beta-D-mannosaminyltransferase